MFWHVLFMREAAANRTLHTCIWVALRPLYGVGPSGQVSNDALMDGHMCLGFKTKLAAPFRFVDVTSTSIGTNC